MTGAVFCFDRLLRYGLEVHAKKKKCPTDIDNLLSNIPILNKKRRAFSSKKFIKRSVPLDFTFFLKSKLVSYFYLPIWIPIWIPQNI